MADEPFANVRRVQSLPIRHRQSPPSSHDRSPSAPPLNTTSQGSTLGKRKRIWQGPPETLQGPESYPYVATLSWSTSSEYRPRNDSKTQDEIKTGTQVQGLHPGYSVYPFIAPPTIYLDESTLAEPYGTETTSAKRKALNVDENESSTAAAEEPLDDTLTSASDQVATAADPSSEHLTPTTATTSAPAAAADVEHEPAHVTDPRCTLQYLRAVPSDMPNGYALIHGQVWRSGTARSGWRRHQWVVGGM